MSTDTLSGDEVAANVCLERHGVCIVRVGGRFRLKGDLPAVQDAYLDDECRSRISPEVRVEIDLFFAGLNHEVVQCLVERGYEATADDLGIIAKDIPGDVLDACSNLVFERYR